MILLTLSLQNFSSILEILAVYYIGTASSELLNKFFGLNETLGRTLKNNPIHSLHVQFNEINRNRVAEWSDDHLDETEKNNKKEKALINVSKLYSKIKKKKAYFLDNNHLYDFIRPFYIFFGVYSVVLLLISGLLADWNKSYVLYFSNTLAFVVGFTMVCTRHRVGPTHKHWGPIKTLSVSSFLFMIILCFPDKLVRSSLSLNHPNILFSNSILDLEYFDFHVTLALILLFVPLIVHFGFLFFLTFDLFLLKRKYKKHNIITNDVSKQLEEINEENRPFLEDFNQLK